jgi:hypothetical protein
MNPPDKRQHLDLGDPRKSLANGDGQFSNHRVDAFSENPAPFSPKNLERRKGYYPASAANGQRPMPIAPPASQRLTAPLANWVGDDASAEQIAAALVDIWHGIAAALTPVIGPLGLAALYRRSLHLTALSHAWLSNGIDGAITDIDPTALKPLFVQRSEADAAAAADCFLRKFHEVLVSLIGASLTERLLRSIWAPTSSGQAAQDNSQ